MLAGTVLGVVIPTRNGAATLAQTLLSLHSQRGIGLSVVVVDSESTDGTLDICRQWRVPVISEAPGNMYRAINAGMRQLATPWLAYLNCDDLMYVDGYARLVEWGERRRLDVVYGDGDFVDARGRFLYSQASFAAPLACRQLAAGTMPFIQPASVFRRHVFHRLGGFTERYAHIADYDFFARAAADGLVFGKLPGRPVAAFRVHASQISTANRHIVDREKRVRRRECGRRGWLARKALSTMWKTRNGLNYLALMGGRR